MLVEIHTELTVKDELLELCMPQFGYFNLKILNHVVNY